MITAIVLAAGRSSRMPGKNKMFLPFGNTTILKHVLAELYLSEIDEIVIVANSAERMHDLAIFANVILAINPNPDNGLTSSIQTGINNSNPESHYMVCLGDMPLITHHSYNMLISKFLNFNSKCIVQPHYQDKPGNPVMFPNSFRQQIIDLKEPNGCKPIVRQYHENVVRAEMPSDSIHLDIDTELDYKAILSRFGLQ